MNFKTLKEKCEYFRSLTDYRLTPGSYVIAMLDGRSFSRLIKNKYKKPFDERFMHYMNSVAIYLCKNIQGAKFAYVQSDEISILITDFDTPTTDSAFGYRICKLQSLLASMAAGKFNQLVMYDEIKSRSYNTTKEDGEETIYSVEDCLSIIENEKLAEFDCKVWAVPDYNTAYCHFLWRQNDCIRNSKQQAAQTYVPNKELTGKTTDEQVEYLEAKTGIDWNQYTDGEKFGRIIYKEERFFPEDGKIPAHTRNVWEAHHALPFGDYFNNVILSLIPKRNE